MNAPSPLPRYLKYPHWLVLKPWAPLLSLMGSQKPLLVVHLSPFLGFSQICGLETEWETLLSSYLITRYLNPPKFDRWRANANDHTFEKSLVCFPTKLPDEWYERPSLIPIRQFPYIFSLLTTNENCYISVVKYVHPLCNSDQLFLNFVSSVKWPSLSTSSRIARPIKKITIDFLESLLLSELGGTPADAGKHQELIPNARSQLLHNTEGRRLPCILDFRWKECCAYVIVTTW